MKDLVLHEALTLLSVCPMPLLLQEAGGRIRACNGAFASLAGTSVEALLGAQHPDDLILPLLGDSTVVNWIMPDGTERWLAVETFAVEGTPALRVRFYLDITEQLRLRNERDALAVELRKSALHDQEIISMRSRRGLLVSLEPLVASSRRYHSPLSVIAIGVRTIPESARVMAQRHMATLLRDQTRWADLVGCNEARDFIMILQETSQDAALQLTTKLATHIERMNSGAAYQLTACYGITDCRKNDDAGALLERAEAALQEAHRNESGVSIAV